MTVGWIFDLKTAWHRARYGWAPRDCWSLDEYLEGVLAGSLEHLAHNHWGTPPGYPNVQSGFEDSTNHEQWTADLLRWSATFKHKLTDDYIEKYCQVEPHDYDGWNKDEAERRKAAMDALKELLPWWGGLWD